MQRSLLIQSGRSELALAATLTTVPFGGDTMTDIRLASVQGQAIALGSDACGS
jgi:hypothetical protein